MILAHSNQKEIDHPNTPADVKREATCLIYTIETGLVPDEANRKAKIHSILTGNGKPANYVADATHLFEAGKYGGYFITTDSRILNRRTELHTVCSATILKPTEWTKLFDESAIPTSIIES